MTGVIVLDTPDQITRWQMLSLKSGISLYLKTGIKARRSYTPTAMREAAAYYTGKLYARSRKGLESALVDMTALLETN